MLKIWTTSGLSSFDPLCDSPLKLRNPSKIPEQFSDMNCSPCLRPIFNSKCCANCFTLNWPGLAYFDNSKFAPPRPFTFTGEPFLQDYYKYFDPYVGAFRLPLPSACLDSDPNSPLCENCYYNNFGNPIFQFSYYKPGNVKAPGATAIFSIPDLPQGDDINTPVGHIVAYYRGPTTWNCNGGDVNGLFILDTSLDPSSQLENTYGFTGFAPPDQNGIVVTFPPSFTIVANNCISPANDPQFPFDEYFAAHPWGPLNWGYHT